MKESSASIDALPEHPGGGLREACSNNERKEGMQRKEKQAKNHISQHSPAPRSDCVTNALHRLLSQADRSLCSFLLFPTAAAAAVAFLLSSSESETYFSRKPSSSSDCSFSVASTSK